MTDRAEYIKGLRQLADWLELNPDVDVPYTPDISLPLSINAKVEDFAAAAGVEVEVDSEGNTMAHVRIGPIDYYAYGYADFDATVAKSSAENARQWANKNGMTLQPVDEGGAR